MYRPMFFLVLSFVFCWTLFVQIIHAEEYLVKLPDAFYQTYSTISSTEKNNFINDYFEFDDSLNITPIFKNHPVDLKWWYLIKTTKVVDHQFAELKNKGKINEFQINQVLKILSTPNDSLYAKQWYFEKIHAVESWNYYFPIEKIILAVIDTGIDYNHSELDSSLWVNTVEDLNQNGRLDSTDINHLDDDGNGYIDDVIGWDFTDAPRFPDGGDYIDPDNNPMDEFQSGHGTQIAGIIAAGTNNRTGIAGIVPGVPVMNLRAGTASGYLEEDDVAEAIVYAIDNGARIINMSFGDVVVSSFMKDVVSYAYSLDIVLVASSGNSGTNEKHFPSGFAETISVGATDSLDHIAGFSTWGQTIDVSAPGENIYSCKIGGGYNYSSGTSFSAPIVSAAAGFILANHPDFSNEQVRNVLKSTADDRGSVGWDPYYGSGRLNLLNLSHIRGKSAMFIENPVSGSHTSANSVPVVVTLQDVDLFDASLWLGIGENPQEWQKIVSAITHQIISDTIAVLDLSDYIEETLVLKLVIQTWQGGVKEYRSLLYVDKTAPVISNMEKITVLDEDRYAVVIGFETDDITAGEIYFRPKNSNIPFTAKNLQYETRQHKVKIRSDEIFGETEFYVRVQNLSGLETQGSNETDYQFTLSPEVFPTLPYQQLNWSFPKGYVLPKIADFDKDGNDEIILSVYDEHNSFGNVVVYEFENNQFNKVHDIGFRAIPRDFGDADNDGQPDLLVGYGKNSFLLETDHINIYPKSIVWQDTVDFWASRITDLDNDGLNEILGRSGAEYKLLETTNDNTFSEKFSFVNPTSGNNAFGPPTTIVDEFDGDQFAELVFGDYDGDIIIYENDGDDSFISRFQTKLPQTDATDFLTSGKWLNSSKSSIFAGTHTDNTKNYEHEFDSRYWSFAHIYADHDNNYSVKQRINIFGYSDIRDVDSGISTGYSSNGTKDYLFVSVHPDLYIFQTNGDSLIPKWYQNGVQSNKVLMHDFDKNGVPEIYFNNGQSFIGYELGESNQPFAPVNFSVMPLDTSAISLTWQAVPGAQKYIIHRGLEAQSISRYDSVINKESFTDSAVIKDQLYSYAIQTYDNSYSNPYSQLSSIEAARPNAPARVDTLIVMNRHQLKINFNEKMLKSSFSPGNFLLSPQNKYASSAIVSKNGYEVLTSFTTPFREDTVNAVILSNIKDADKTALDTVDRKLLFFYSKSKDVPYISKWNLEDRYHLTITFNIPMDTQTIFNPENYKLEPEGEVTQIVELDNDNTSFRLTFSKDSFLGSTGIVTYISFNKIKSINGTLFEEGNRFSITSAKTHLKDLIVYPQPVKYDEELVTFANITERTEIQIFDIHGHFIKKLIENDKNGGISWNMRNENGEKVSSGIYIYYAKNEKETKSGKFAIVR